VAQALMRGQTGISIGDRERLLGYLEGSGIIVLPEPQPLLTETSKMPGLDGRKMSKSYGNAITLREDPDAVAQKMRTMPTDPARVRRSDPGDPAKCPVWGLHQVYSDEARRAWVQEGCRSAGIGCLDCKKPLIEAVQAELVQFRERARPFEDDPGLLREIVAAGCEQAREVARETLDEVRQVMGLGYR
jgi:tryptophanyl-tRNA synthetase